MRLRAWRVATSSAFGKAVTLNERGFSKKNGRFSKIRLSLKLDPAGSYRREVNIRNQPPDGLFIGSSPTCFMSVLETKVDVDRPYRVPKVYQLKQCLQGGSSDYMRKVLYLSYISCLHEKLIKIPNWDRRLQCILHLLAVASVCEKCCSFSALDASDRVQD